MAQIEQTILANGVTVITDHNSAAPLLYANIVFRAGNLHDFVRPGSNSRKGEVERVVLNGLAHFTEHVIPHGHPTLGLHGLNELQQEMGFTPNTANFETGDNNTSFYAHGAPENVLALLPTYARMLTSAQPTEEALQFERPRIMDEMATQWQTQSAMSRKWFFDKFYTPENVRQQFTGGHPDTLATISLDDIAAFVRSNYTANNCAFITSGAMSHAEACAFAEEHLGELPQGPRNQPIIPQRQLGDIINTSYRNTTRTEINLYLPFPTLTLANLGQAQLIAKICKDNLRAVADANAIYGIPVSVGYGAANDLYLHITATCAPEAAENIAHAIADNLADTFAQLDEASFARQKHRMLLMAQNENAVKAGDARERGLRLTFNFSKDEPLLADTFDTKSIDGATLDSTRHAMRAMLLAVPTTYHYEPQNLTVWRNYATGTGLAGRIATRLSFAANDNINDFPVNGCPVNDFLAPPGSGQPPAPPYSPSPQR